MSTNESKEDRCEGFKDNSRQIRTANQSTRASALDTLLDSSLNVHSVINTSDFPTVSVLGCCRNITIPVLFLL